MKNLTEFKNWYETLSENSLKNIEQYYSADIFFKDPFNEIKGISKLEIIFLEMFDQLDEPRFQIIDIVQQEEQVFLTWNFFFTYSKKAYSIHGSSHLKLNDTGLVIYHRDYWDVGEELLLKIPFIGSVYGILRKKIGTQAK